MKKLDKLAAMRRANQIKADRVTAETMLKRAQKRMQEVWASETELRKQCPHPKELISEIGFDYFIETCGLCGNTETY